MPSKTLLRPGEAVHGAREASATAEVNAKTALAWRDFMVSEYSDALIDLVVELVVDDQPVDVPILLRAPSIELVRDEEDLERAASTRQPGEPGHRTAPGRRTCCDLELAEPSVLP
jgi:hypothetical protein